MQPLQPSEVRLFFDPPRGREYNDKDGRRREAIVGMLADRDQAQARQLMAHVRYGKQWAQVHTQLFDTLSSASRVDRRLTGGVLIGATSRGGRRFRYDLETVFMVNGQLETAKVEFKRGRSIYEQPQFLSLPATRFHVVGPGVESYAEYFEAHYVGRLKAQAQTSRPNRKDYLRLVAQTQYKAHPFFLALYRDEAHASDNKKKRAAWAAESIDAYLLSLLDRGPKALSWAALESAFLEQQAKLFLSWDTSVEDFKLERFLMSEMLLTRRWTLGTGRDGLHRYADLENGAGGRIRMLLRWRNHKCVLNPAWQIAPPS